MDDTSRMRGGGVRGGLGKGEKSAGSTASGQDVNNVQHGLRSSTGDMCNILLEESAVRLSLNVPTSIGQCVKLLGQDWVVLLCA